MLRWGDNILSQLLCHAVKSSPGTWRELEADRRTTMEQGFIMGGQECLCGSWSFPSSSSSLMSKKDGWREEARQTPQSPSAFSRCSLTLLSETHLRHRSPVAKATVDFPVCVRAPCGRGPWIMTHPAAFRAAFLVLLSGEDPPTSAPPSPPCRSISTSSLVCRSADSNGEKASYSLNVTAEVMFSLSSERKNK